MISIARLRKNFQSGDHAVAALAGIDLEVAQGEFFVLLGPSGSGKTTLLRSVAGLEKPDQGEITLNGKVVFSSGKKIATYPEEREIGMVFQSYAIWPHLTVAENIGLVLTRGRLRMSKRQARERIGESLAMVQLDGFENRPARLLSGGQQQRVALARALAVNPALLLMDEPLSNLDARLREEVRSTIKKLTAKLGITVLYVTHDQVEAMVLADRIAVMSQGKILQIGNPFDLYRSPANALVAEFFGSINWLHGKMTGDYTAETAIGDLAVANIRTNRGAVVIGIRPEDIRWAPTFPAAENRLKGKVVSSTFLGDQAIAEIEINGQLLTVKSLPEQQMATGNASIDLPAAKLVVFSES